MEESKIDYAGVLASLEAKRAQIDAAIAAIREVAGMVPESPRAAQQQLGLSDSRPAVAERGYEGMSVVAAAEAYLRVAAKPQTAPEIARALKRGGVTSSAQTTFSATVYNRLHKAAQRGTKIIKIGKAFGLPEWSRKEVLRTVS